MTLLVAVVCGLLSEVAAWGPIKHMTVLEEVIRHPDLDPEIRNIVQDNLKYAEGGAVGPDQGNLICGGTRPYRDLPIFGST